MIYLLIVVCGCVVVPDLVHEDMFHHLTFGLVLMLEYNHMLGTW